MICSLFNFCAESAQSCRHRGAGRALVDLTLQTKVQAPKIETLNTIN